MNTSPNPLTSYVKQIISEAGGQISFATFMELVLFHPEWGYYNSEKFALGKQGDFTTAAEISPLYAQCFARQSLPILTQMQGEGKLLEIGAGSGQFAYDFLSSLEALGCVNIQYYIYEKSGSLRRSQQEHLKKLSPTLFSQITWLDELPTNFVGIIMAHEVLDVLPFHRFKIEEEIKEQVIALENDQFVWQSVTTTNLDFSREVSKLKERNQLAVGYESEINLQYTAFIKNLARSLKYGVIFLADYGYSEQEYYHPQRSKGTLTCFYQHHHHDDPLIHIGKQDITAHVDFTRIAEIASEENLSIAGYTTQAAFLLACGLLKIAEEEEKSLTEAEKFNLHQAIKLLTLPIEMGEVIKIMALTRDIETNLFGFAWQDRRRDL